MNDELRALIMLVITNILALGAAFGLNLSGDQVGAVTSVGNSILLLFMYIWNRGQGERSL